MAVKRRIKVNKRFYVLVALVVVALFAVQFIKANVKLAQQQKILAQLDEQIAQAQQYNDSLESQIASADSLENIEQTARRQLGWVKENEILYIAETDAQEDTQNP